MIVNFTNLNEFIEEIERVKPELVRIAGEKMEKNNAQDHVVLHSGFVKDGVLHEFSTICGCDPAENFGGEKVGSKAADQLIQKLAGRCEELKVPIARGRYVP